MAFNPDEFIAKTAPQKAFDPDAFIAKNKPVSGPPELLGELSVGDRMKRSFASGDAERKGLLQKDYPGIEFISDNLVKLPGEGGARYIDDPKYTATDIADFAGDIPVVAGGIAGSLMGGIPGLVAGTGLGESARKAMGRGLIGIENQRGLGGDLLDIAEAGVAAPLLEGAGNQIVAPAVRAAGQGVKAVKNKVGGLIADASESLGGLLPKKAMQGFSQIEKAVADANKAGTMPELPTLQELNNAEKVLTDLQYPVSPIQKTMYQDKQSMDMVGALRKAPVKQGKALSDYEMLQKNELNQKLGETIQSLAPDHTPNVLPEESGNALINTVKASYKQTKKDLAPAFEMIQSAPLPPAQSRMASLRMRLGSEISELGDNFVTYGPGGTVIAPYNRAMGVSPKEYALVKDAVDAVSNPNLSIKQIQAVRESLRNEIAPNEAGYKMVGRLRKVMLDHIGDMVDETIPNAQVKNTFKSWAQNEARRDAVESILGGRLESFTNLEKPVAEKVLNNMFADTQNVQIMREALGPKEFAKFTTDYVTQLLARATDKGNLSSQGLSRVMKQKAPVLREAFRGNEAGLQRLQAIVDLMRIVPDAPPANPSGTATTKSWLDIITKPREAAAGLLKSRGERRAGKKLAEEIEKRAGVEKKRRTTGAKGLILDRIRKEGDEGGGDE